MSKRIAIVGAGMSGMTATKACLEQGFDVVVYEKTNYTGGLWRYQENTVENGIASIMKSTIINSSKEMSAFSDFPPPADYPNYMHNTKMISYLDMYGESFNFIEHIKFHHEIISIEMTPNYDETGKWQIKARNLKSESLNKEIVETFDGVMICTGHHSVKNEPTFKGQGQFKGTVIHSHSLKRGKNFEDKNVVVVGIGNSGGDAAVEISSVAKQVYLSTRTGSWIFHRVGLNGRPFDQYVHRRFFAFLFKILPYKSTCWAIELFLNNVFNHREYQLKPKHRVLSQHIMVNDELPNRVLSGTVQIKGDIEYFAENGVKFKGDDSVTPCDTVILATGYKIAFKFIGQELSPVKNNTVRLYKWQFMPDIKHPHTVAFISLVQPIGALMPIAELQSRWYAQLMTEKITLPSSEEMQKDILKKEKFQERFYRSERHTVQVDWVPFMDELAKEIRVFPPIAKYLCTDFKLFFALIFGPSVSYQYRLIGPNSWPHAREAVLSVQNRIDAPLKTNHACSYRMSNFSIMKLDFVQYLSIFVFLFVGLFFMTIILIFKHY